MIRTLLDGLSQKWWVLLLRGILAILFGILAFTMPGLTIASLVMLLGVYFLVDGIVAIWAGGTAGAWGIVLSGIVGVIAGIYTFMSPGAAAVGLIWVIAIWAVVRGILEIVAAIQVRKEIENEWMLILGGVFSIIVGIWLFLRPGAGALGMMWLIGSFAIIYGIVMIVLSFRLKSLPGRLRSAVKGA